MLFRVILKEKVLFYYQELQVKDTDDVSAQPKCQSDTGNNLGHEMDTKSKTDTKNAKKSNLVKSGPVSEKKSGNSKPAIVQVKAHLSKVRFILYIPMSVFWEIILNAYL